MDSDKYNRRFENENGYFTVRVDENFLCTSTFFGRGSMVGTRAFIQMLEEISHLLSSGAKYQSLLDLTGLRGTPLRAQLSLGRWMLKNKGRVDKVAIVGAKAWERRIAKAVMKIARFKRIDFFQGVDEALCWLSS
jgi:hypothetical protein